MACQVCDSAKRHWHCFAQSEEGAWMCDACCKVVIFTLFVVVVYEIMYIKYLLTLHIFPFGRRCIFPYKSLFKVFIIFLCLFIQ